MGNIINLLDTSKFDFKIFEAAGKVANNLNCKAYLVGGYIRDKLLNKSPAKDIDITVCGDFMQYAQALAKELNIETIVPFEQFKTARLVHPELEIEKPGQACGGFLSGLVIFEFESI